MQLSSRLLSVPLAKYSRATDVTRDIEQFTWSHIQHDLLLVIDSFYRSETGHDQATQYLRVLHGTQILVGALGSVPPSGLDIFLTAMR